MPADRRELGRQVAARARAAAQPRLQEAARKGVLDLASLPRDLRLLAVAGYVLVTSLLVAVLVCEVAGRRLPGVIFTDTDGVWRVPTLALGLSALGLVTGWAYLLTGGGYRRRRIFLPVAALGLFEFLALLGAVEPGNAWLGALGALALAVGAHRVARSHPDWRERALPRFLPWLAVSTLLIGPVWRAARGSSRVAESLDIALVPLFMLAWPFCLLIGFELVDGGIHLAGAVVGRLQRRLPEWAVRRVAVPVSLLCWMAVLAVIGESRPTVLLEGLGLAVLVVMVVFAGALVAWLARRWSTRAAAATLGLQIAALPLGVGLALAIQGQNLPQYFLSTTDVFPPTFLFAAFVVYDALNFGPRFANGDSRILPRSGRVLLYFGLVILVLSFALLRLSARSATTGRMDGHVQEVIDGFVVLGILAIGTPYLVWVFCKRRERLTGEWEAADP